MTSSTSDATRFAFRFTGANKAMVLLGLTPRTCYLELRGDDVVVQFGWAFRCRFPRTSITSITDDTEPVRAWGAHGWRRVWLVNGTSKALLRIDLEPLARGRVLLFPLRIRALRLGIDDAAAFRTACAP